MADSLIVLVLLFLMIVILPYLIIHMGTNHIKRKDVLDDLFRFNKKK